MKHRRLSLLLAAATVGAMVSVPGRPARAGVSTAAWTTASTFCKGLAVGLSIPEATRVAWRDNQLMWASEMQDPAFSRFLVAEALQQCPDLMQQNAAQQ